ncbi:pyridoxamine 5'-phosphate oxidase [Deltaproteobacteria bacterium IMCC39524]|nr:pyridoxamine 5'-phosphate oxidase [Deltaproteobacteria bacterium IMCC39524]
MTENQQLDPDPFKQFARWFADAEQAELPLHNAMTLATASRAGKPSARMVLLKEVDASGFVFYTNYQGRKARELKENPFAALVFYWQPLSRQVRVEGAVERVASDESDRYFASRPRGHQLEAHASSQSQVIKDRGFLEEQFKTFTQMFAGQEIPRPAHWGGYRLLPETLEFWQEGEHRLHDRLRYRRIDNDQWVIERLAP